MCFDITIQNKCLHITHQVTYLVSQTKLMLEIHEIESRQTLAKLISYLHKIGQPVLSTNS